MKMILMIVLSWSFSIARGQEIVIGQHMPDILIPHIDKYKDTSAHISDFKGKLLILDFWSIGCGGCIAAFPKMEFLQKKFRNSIQILTVTPDKRETVDSYFSKLIGHKLPDLPEVTGDSVLTACFPHHLVPHHIWINESGIVQAITNGYNTNEENIQEWINGKKMQFAIKHDETAFNYDIPLWQHNDLIIDRVRQSSLFTGYIPGIKCMECLRTNANGIKTGFLFTNTSMEGLYAFAFGSNGFDSPFQYGRRTLWLVKDKEKYNYVKVAEKNMDSWMSSYTFCYEISIPESRTDKLYKFMQQDLNRFFGEKYGFTANVEEIMADCLILRRTGKIDKIASRHRERSDNLKLPESDKYIYQHPLSTLIGYLQTEAGNVQVIDETHYTGDTDLEFKDPLNNPESVSKDLLKYDLVLVPAKRKLKMLVIRE